ncbi:DUF1801 domain-containing protein [Parasphingorhabdus cellanae]|uniref:DUF1801 domain-containing protein n=1 Tax=Parasphingorhabdus cellanae TaxID=2806553 RepID=A0ABX7T0U3_9SPHN|nr:DUF1801 domain-containing protein [Parasphingorhabdus cellanae]QTD54776.1 DUF1801 domain-containing protein [Parasphingorhabdus cellanae]
MIADIPPQTQLVFDNLPKATAARLIKLRALIFDTAADNPAIGPLEETLKWGEPAYLTSATKSGTTVRINRHKKSDGQYAIYVHCQTNLVERYKQLYSDVLTFEGSRAIVFDVDQAIPTEAVKHCLTMALTYHLRA